MEKKFMVAGILLSVLLFSSIGYTFEWKDTCLNSTTLFKTADIWITGNLTTINQTIDCEYGCSISLSDCKPAPMENNIWVIGALCVVILLMYAGVKTIFSIGVPLMIINIFITVSFIVIDFFNEYVKIIFASLILVELGLMFYLVERGKDDE